MITPTGFFVPKKERLVLSEEFLRKKRLTAIIPTYKPRMITYRLAKTLSEWNQNMLVIVVDDSTPKDSKFYRVCKKIKKLAASRKNIVCLRTPSNKLKAGALNFGLDYINVVLSEKPNVVITLDDDVVLNKETVPEMIKTLYSEVSMGAVCSMARVKNKNKNILTRLQAMEYHSFNVTKISDTGFLKGPLVMPGMITAFRYGALREVNGFTTGHLIEDYDLTAKLKVKGWKVGISRQAIAWTEVQEDLGALWRQRVRWTVGGLAVVKDFWQNTTAVFQDLVGHLLFMSLFTFIIFSFVFACDCGGDPVLVMFLIGMAVVNFLAANAFNLLTFLEYTQKDRLDWVLKMTILPEFFYSTFLTFVLMGSYLFFVYNEVLGKLFKRVRSLEKVYNKGLALFLRAGYSYTWGTK